MLPSEPYDARARHLRALYRQHRRAEQYGVVKAEYERLFPVREVQLDQILVSAFVEGRELAGWRRDKGSQSWRRGDGSLVLVDDGSEWSHL